MEPFVHTPPSEEILSFDLEKITPPSNLISNTALSSLAATSTTTAGLMLFKATVGLAFPVLFSISTVALAALGIHRLSTRAYELKFTETLHDFPGENKQPMVAICGYPFDAEIVRYKLGNKILGLDSAMSADFERLDFFINGERIEDFKSAVRKIYKLLPKNKYGEYQLTRISHLFNTHTCIDLNDKVASFFKKHENLLKKVSLDNIVFENHDKSPFVHLNITPNESYIYSSIIWEAYDAIDVEVREDRLIKSNVLHNLVDNSSTYSFSL